MKMRLLSLPLLLLLTATLSACAQGMSKSFAEVPVGKAYVNGEEIFFSHTETSDADVAKVLTDMMNSPVLMVTSLADAPDTMTSPVYVFQNGVAGMGPLSFQADVFPNQPGDEGYTPLRRIVFVKWIDESQAGELKSEAEILQLADKGALTLEETNIVVNMPFMTWKDGKR